MAVTLWRKRKIILRNIINSNTDKQQTTNVILNAKVRDKYYARRVTKNVGK